MTLLFIASISSLILAIWIRFSKDEKTITQIKTDLLLARKVAERADDRSVVIEKQLPSLIKNIELSFSKASTAEFVAHSAKMDTSRVQRHSLTLRIKSTKKKLKPKNVEQKIVDKIKSQIKDLSQ